jgi:phenylacetate-CoA ligase
MMKIRGNNVWPVAVDAVVFAHAAVGEYAGRVFVDDFGRTEVEVRVAFKPDFAAAPGDTRTTMLQQIASAIKAKTNVTMIVMEVPRTELPTFEYKARRWKDERQAGYDKAVKS